MPVLNLTGMDDMEVVMAERRTSMQYGRRRAGGQAMVLFLMLMGVLCLGLVFLFDTGQSVNKKVSLTNTADAAAYSVAVQQARAMNYAAYMNRGRIANEVAIAQLVSLWSWMNMLHTHTVVGYNVFLFLSYIPLVDQVAKPLLAGYTGAERVAAAMREGYHAVAPAAVRVLDELNGLYATSAEAMLKVGSTVDGIVIARDVVRMNDATAEISPLGQTVLASQLRQAGSSGTHGLLDEFSRGRKGSRTPGMDRYRNVVMASRDHFSADRNSELGLPLIDIESSGGTDLVDYDRWVALDTLDLSVLFWKIPLGWGGAQALDQAARQPPFRPGIASGGRNGRRRGWYDAYHGFRPRTLAQYGGVSRRSVSGRLAARNPSVDAPLPVRPSGSLNQKRHAFMGGYEGLRSYQDVKPGFGRTPVGEKAGPIFTVHVQSARANARTSEDVEGIGGPSAGALELKNAMRGNRMTAMASAQTYFNRPPASALFRRVVPRQWDGPPRADDQLEMGSLFSPYWQARLVETPKPIQAALGLGT